MFRFTPAIESGVYITIPTHKIYGILCSQSNSQRAYMQMLARCRNVKDGQIDVANGPFLKINNNHNFWSYNEVFDLNKDTVQPGMRFVVTGSQLRLTDNVDTKRKSISVFNEVERLSKHPSLFINHLNS